MFHISIFMKQDLEKKHLVRNQQTCKFCFQKTCKEGTNYVSSNFFFLRGKEKSEMKIPINFLKN